MPFLLFKKLKNINVSIISFVTIGYIFLNFVYLFIDRNYSPILNWNLILMYCTLVTISGRVKNVILLLQVLGLVCIILIKFNFADLIQIVSLPGQVDPMRIIGNMFFISLCAYLFTKAYVQIQLVGNQQNINKDNTIKIENRLRAAQSLAEGLSHEINNPLTILNGNLLKIQSMINRNENLDAVNHKIEQAFKASERIQYIIKRVLNWTQIENYNSNSKMGNEDSEIEIDNIVKTVLLNKGEQISKKNILLNLDIQNQKVPSQFRNIEFVLEELLNNALDMADNKSVLSLLEANEMKEVKKLIFEIKVYFQLGWCNLEISNNGPELKADSYHSIFDPFKTQKLNGIGRGMGLTIVFSIINKMNGNIFVNRVNGFTVFYIHIPVIQSSVVNNKLA